MVRAARTLKRTTTATGRVNRRSAMIVPAIGPTLSSIVSKDPATDAFALAQDGNHTDSSIGSHPPTATDKCPDWSFFSEVEALVCSINLGTERKALTNPNLSCGLSEFTF